MLLQACVCVCVGGGGGGGGERERGWGECMWSVGGWESVGGGAWVTKCGWGECGWGERGWGNVGRGVWVGGAWAGEYTRSSVLICWLGRLHELGRHNVILKRNPADRPRHTTYIYNVRR